MEPEAQPLSSFPNSRHQHNSNWPSIDVAQFDAEEETYPCSDDWVSGARPEALEVFGLIFPWLLSALLGVLTALTGSFITVNCDFLSDLRFGFCRGLYFADRNRCCGGSDNVNFLRERCIEPVAIVPSAAGSVAQWVPWSEYFGTEDSVESLGGGVISFLMYVLPSLLYTGIAVFLVLGYSPSARGSGIPEVKAAVSGFDLPQTFSAWCLLVKTVGLSFAVGAGLSLGKEGPLIHIGACWAYILRHLVAKPVAELIGHSGELMPLHELACVGSAAGVSTAFGAPLGGVLFAVEELGSVRELGRRTLLFAFMAAFSASFTLKYLNLSGANRLTLFALSMPSLHPKKEWMIEQMGAFLLLGVIGGLGGAFFIHTNLWVTEERRRSQQRYKLWMLPNWLHEYSMECWPLRCFTTDSSDFRGATFAMNIIEGMLIALITALLNYPFTTMLRSMSNETIHALFETCPHIRASHFGLCDAKSFSSAHMGLSIELSLLLAAGTRILQTSYTFGAALPSGLFIPSLFIGACVGRFIGNVMLIVNEHKTHIEPGVFAMVGAIAMLSGFCRMTVSIVVIMLELTGEITYVVPFMCATLAAKLIGDLLTPSIYDAHAKLNGLAPIDEQEDIRLQLQLADLVLPLASSDIIDASAPIPLEALMRIVGSCDDPFCDEGTHLEASDPDLPDALILVLSDSTRRASSTDAVLGVVERVRLQRWLLRVSKNGPSEGWLCSFSQALNGTSSNAGLWDDNSSPTFRRMTSPPMRVLDGVLDASHLVDLRIERLAPLAPLLTVLCLFEQKPHLQYCLCVDELWPSVTLLSRKQFDAALSSAHFPLLHPPATGFGVGIAPVRGTMSGEREAGAAATVAMIRRAWRQLVWRFHFSANIGLPLMSRRDVATSVTTTPVHEMSNLSSTGL